VRYPGEVVSEADLAGLPGDLLSAVGRRDRYFDRSVLEERIAKPIAVARGAGLPLYCGEWGALPSAPRADRLRWYADLRSALEKYGSAGRPGTTRRASASWTASARWTRAWRRCCLSAPTAEPIRSAGLGVFESETEVGDVELPRATVFDGAAASTA
jgi:hypothetical protein